MGGGESPFLHSSIVLVIVLVLGLESLMAAKEKRAGKTSTVD
jgi:hypothetical protein